MAPRKRTRITIYAGLFTTLVGAAFYAYRQYDEVRRLEELRQRIDADLNRLSQVCVETRSRVDVLAGGDASLQSIVQFLGIVSLNDHGPRVGPLEEWSRSLDPLPAQIIGYEARLKELETARSVPNRKDGDAALAKIAALQAEVDNFREQLKNIESSGREHIQTIDAILEKERRHIFSGLRLFAASLDGVLNEISSAEEGDKQAEVDLEVTRASALYTARLAELLYMPESIIKKQRNIFQPTPSIQAINERLIVDQDHKKLLQKLISSPAREQIRTSVAFAAQAGSPWHVRTPGLNVRVAPSVNTAVLCTLFQDERLRPMKTDGYWWPVSTRCGNGWVAAKYLRRH